MIVFLSADPEDTATVTFFLDADGDLSTTDDQFPLGQFTSNLGSPQTVFVESTGIPEEEYFLLGVATDGHHPPVVATGPGAVTLANVASSHGAGGNADDIGLGITNLGDGSSLVTGLFNGTAVFGEGEPAQTILTSAGDDDIFVARYDPDGRLVWAKRAGGTQTDAGMDIAAGSGLVTGRFSGTAIFGPGESNQTTLVSEGGDDIFVAHYDLDGTLDWAMRAGGTQGDAGLGIATPSDGSSLVTGTFSGTATFDAAGPNQTTLVSDGAEDVFLARYNAGGSLAWAKRAGGNGGDTAHGVAALADGSSLVAGFFAGTATFGFGETHETVLVSAGDQDIFVARYDSDGSVVWAKRAGGSANDRATTPAAAADGSTLVTGCFSQTATFGAGKPHETTLVSSGLEDIFVARYGPDGNLAWAKRAGGAGRSIGDGIATFPLPDGSSVVTGSFEQTATFGPGEPNQTILVSTGAQGVFVARYDPDGSLVWARTAEGTTGEGGHGVATVIDGSSLVVGAFAGTVIFGGGDPNASVFASKGEKDIFVARYNADGDF